MPFKSKFAHSFQEESLGLENTVSLNQTTISAEAEKKRKQERNSVARANRQAEVEARLKAEQEAVAAEKHARIEARKAHAAESRAK